jgi:hypothetical protein
MNSNERYSSLDRTLGTNKPVDPATRLSELLAQSLEELTRPFEPPRAAAVAAPEPGSADPAGREAAAELASEQTPEESRIDADKALAELEAELFAAAKQVDRETPAEAAEVSGEPEEVTEHEPVAAHAASSDAEAVHLADPEKMSDAPNEADIAPPPLAPEQPPAPGDADAARVIAKVRKLMLVSMAVTILAVGSVFGFIGYRMFKGEGTTAKTADKLPEASAIPTDITLALPRGARVIQAAVAADRLVITLEVDGKVEVRTFDVMTLQPAGRINFTATP